MRPTEGEVEMEGEGEGLGVTELVRVACALVRVEVGDSEMEAVRESWGEVEGVVDTLAKVGVALPVPA